MAGDGTVNAVCWAPKVALGESAASTPAVPSPGTPQADLAQWSVTVHRDFIEATTGTPGATTGGTISARFNRRTRETTTTADLRVFGVGRPKTGPGGLVQLRRAVEACAARESGTERGKVLGDALSELQAREAK